jgi:hypothetical protein
MLAAVVFIDDGIFGAGREMGEPVVSKGTASVDGRGISPMLSGMKRLFVAASAALILAGASGAAFAQERAPAPMAAPAVWAGQAADGNLATKVDWRRDNWRRDHWRNDRRDWRRDHWRNDRWHSQHHDWRWRNNHRPHRSWR